MFHRLRKNIIRIAIFVLALGVRFYFFRESVYFGFDEARDAFTSQEIYNSFDFKLLGPPANYPGIFHGPLFWYLIGPLYLLFQGDHFSVSAVFRVFNALGVFLIFLIGKKLFDKKVGLLAALIYAVSFEETQYAMYVGNPSLGVLAFMGIFLGATLILKEKKYFGLVVMLTSSAIATQLEFILAYTFVICLLFLVFVRAKIRHFNRMNWISAIGVAVLILSTFIVSEVKFNFQSTRALINLFTTGYDIMRVGDTRLTLYLRMFTDLFKLNIFDSSNSLTYFLVFIFVASLGYFAVKIKETRLVLLWIFSGLVILPFGGYDAFYVNVGIGAGMILGASFLLTKVYSVNKVVFILFLCAIIFSNLNLIRTFNSKGLIVQIKAQQFMSLQDELALIDKTYEYAKVDGFTIRVTSMPYKVQTVWAYLYQTYAKSRWGYLPFWETELVAGYPGTFPRPAQGTTCTRFLIREPVRGIPENLINDDVNEENFFSEVVSEENVGNFILQVRKAHGECHNLKTVN